MIHEEILSRLRPITAEENAILSGDGNIDRTIYTEQGSNVINARKLLDSGKLINIRPHTRFVHFPEHCHDYVELVYMVQGSTTHIANGTRIELHEGELLFLGQGARQEILPSGEQDLAVNLIILPQFFDKALEMLGEDETPLRRFIIDSLREEASGYLYFKVADVLPIQNLVENLLWTLIHDVPNRRSINQTTMGLLFLQLVNHSDHLVTDRDKDAAMLRVFRYIEEHYRDGSLTDLASLMHYDFCWLSREIKTRTGKTYTELVQDKRLSQSAFLLRSTTLHIDDIASAVGYSNMSYFHRLFQKQYGTSPKKYRDKRGKPA